jgi:chromosome segregation ATPase
MPNTQIQQKISSIEVDVEQLSDDIKETDNSLTELEKSVIAIRTRQDFVDKSIEQNSDDVIKTKAELTETVKQLDEVKAWQSSAVKLISWIGVTFSGSALGLVARAIYNYVTELISEGHSSN